MELKKTERLENGLTLNLFDASRKIAGDRWFISILARVEIPVKSGIFDEKGLLVTVEDARALIGDTVVFEQKRERNFISKDEKEEVISQILRDFLANVVPYLGNEKFPVNFLKKIYKEARKRELWYK